MTTSASFLSNPVPVHLSRNEHRSFILENFSQNSHCPNSRLHLTHSEALTEIVIEALELTFPGHPSQDSRAKEACEFFINEKTGRPIDYRTVEYWLSKDTLPAAEHLASLAGMQPRLFIPYFMGLKS